MLFSGNQPVDGVTAALMKSPVFCLFWHFIDWTINRENDPQMSSVMKIIIGSSSNNGGQASELQHIDHHLAWWRWLMWIRKFVGLHSLVLNSLKVSFGKKYEGSAWGLNPADSSVPLTAVNNQTASFLSLETREILKVGFWPGVTRPS